MKVEREVLSWLLEPGQPSVRFHTLTELLDREPDDGEVVETSSNIPKRGWAHDIMAEQKEGGYWESRDDLYRPKYLATIWRLIVLSDLGVTSRDARVRRSCELFLSEYSRPDGGFDIPGSSWSRSELCLTGNLARTLLRSGHGDDPRVRSAFDWLVEHQMEDGGWHCFYERSFGRGTLDCWEGLGAFAAYPRQRWTRGMKLAVERGAEFYLKRELFRQGRHRYAPWFRFHYPVHYYYDVLVGLDVMTGLGYGGDRRLGAALQILAEKRRADGRWVLDAAHPDLGAGAGYRVKARPFSLEEKGSPSKWITLTALRVLKRVEEASGA